MPLDLCGFRLTGGFVASDTGDGAILPTWTAVDNNNVRTTRELMEQMRDAGWNLEVRSAPISSLFDMLTLLQYYR